MLGAVSLEMVQRSICSRVSVWTLFSFHHCCWSQIIEASSPIEPRWAFSI